MADWKWWMVALLACLQLNGTTGTLCPCGYSGYQGSCYILLGKEQNDKKTWPDARLDCQQRGGDLASVTDQQEQDFIWGKRGSIAEVWIGLFHEEGAPNSDLAARRAGWKWTDGAQYSWMNWLDGGDENGDPQAEENAVRMEASTGGSAVWKGKKGDDDQYGYACERKPFYGSNTVCSSERCYTFVEEAKTWSEARDHCQSINQQLLSLTSGTIASIRADAESVIGDALCDTNEMIYWVQDGQEGTLCHILSIKSADDRWSLGTDVCSDVHTFICTRQQLCSLEWKENSGYCYLSSNNAVYQSEAQRICKVYDSDLLTIESPHEENYIHSTFPIDTYWMHIKRDDNIPTRVSYSYWASGYPKDDHLCFYTYQSQWYSDECNNLRSYICKQEFSAFTPITNGMSASEATVASYSQNNDVSPTQIFPTNGQEPTPASFSTGLVAGAASAAIVIIVLLIVILILLIKYDYWSKIRGILRKQGQEEENQGSPVPEGVKQEQVAVCMETTRSAPLGNKTQRPGGVQGEDSDEDEDEDEDEASEGDAEGLQSSPIYGNAGKGLTNPIPLADLNNFISKNKSMSKPFVEEYVTIPIGETATCTAAKESGQIVKNRFKNIFAYDHSRVVLEVTPGDPLSHYFNASYIDGYSKKKAYIASQGPNKACLGDFWRMLWQKCISVIIMVTNVMEGKKTKCEIYWGATGKPKTFADITVRLMKEQELADYTIREIKANKGGETRVLKQFHFTSWPDKGVPKHATALLNFRKICKAEMIKRGPPPVVHCSAGIGRTGTFIALDYLLEQADVERVVDVYKCVNMMRDNRMNMVQTLEQYTFIYDALLEATTLGDTTVPGFQFTSTYGSWSKPDGSTGKSKLQAQFDMLGLMKEHSQIYDQEATGENSNKNRTQDILPVKAQRVMLMTPVTGRNQYINAVYVEGYRKKGSFLATQAPLPDTVIDLWRLAYDYKCAAIVSLVTQEKLGSGATYWPDPDQPLSLPPFVIQHKDMRDSKFLITTTFTISHKKSREIQQIRVKKSLDGLSQENRIKVLISMYLESQKIQQQSGDRKIAVHCLNGAQWTGVFCAVCALCDMINREQEVDIFQITKMIQKSRPQFINTMDEYKLLYATVDEYIKSFDTYSNFQ